MKMSSKYFVAFLAMATGQMGVHGFLTLSPKSRAIRSTTTSTSNLHMNFFKDVLGKAFENDSSLDTDKTKGQYDGPNDDYEDGISVARQVNTLTDTQKKWRETQQSSGTPTPALLLENTKWTLDLYLTGIPDRDPSNDLFASKVNISSRDRQVGLMIPEVPTVAGIEITLLEGGICQVNTESEFIDASAGDGQWKVSDDGSMIRISLNVMGYQRTVQTKGSIEKIFWSNEEEKSVQTTSAYTIPAGPMYGDASLSSGRQVGTLQWQDGIFRVEQSAGLLGAGSKMVPCGRFAATPLT